MARYSPLRPLLLSRTSDENSLGIPNWHTYGPVNKMKKNAASTREV